MTSYAILGAGLSGRAAYDYLLGQGEREISLYVPQEACREAEGAFPHAHVRPFGEKIGEDVVVRSPGIRPDHPAILAALARGARLTQEVELFLDACRADVYAVTGSDGKTTTVAVASELLREMGYTVWLGGNIGVPLLSRLGEIERHHRVVLELSSFQLMTLSPRLAAGAVTNLTENHLNWHRDMEEYRRAKRNILPFAARRIQHASLPMGVEYPTLTFSATQESASYALRYGWLCHGEERLARAAQVRLPGRYNLENMLCAAALTEATADALGTVAESFRGVRHRMEHLGCFLGREVYNSSIDTTPSRTAATLSGVTAPATVLVGGAGKQLDNAPLTRALMAHARRAVFTGQTGEEMREHLLSHPGYRGTPTAYFVPDFDGAVRLALRMTPVGEWLILSPAATSFDAFSSYEERGDVFSELIKRITQEQETP